MKTQRSPFAAQLKAIVIAVGLSIVPVHEVDSGVSYGGGIALDFNGNVSVGGHILSTDKANALFGKVGLNYIVRGQDQGDLSLRLGVGYIFKNGIAPSIEGSITPTSASPFSIGAGIGLSSVKKDKKREVNGEVEEESLVCIGRCCMNHIAGMVVACCFLFSCFFRSAPIGVCPAGSFD